jgi:hypothetical protein
VSICMAVGGMADPPFPGLAPHTKLVGSGLLASVEVTRSASLPPAGITGLASPVWLCGMVSMSASDPNRLSKPGLSFPSREVVEVVLFRDQSCPLDDWRGSCIFDSSSFSLRVPLVLPMVWVSLDISLHLYLREAQDRA